MNRRMVLLAAFCMVSTAWSQSSVSPHKQVEKLVDDGAANWKQVSKQVWDYAELGYHETKSSPLLQARGLT